MKNYQTKIEARKILKNVNKSQFAENLDNYHAFFSTYRTLDQVIKSTEKAFFIAEPEHEECKKGFWIPKSQCKFKMEFDNTNDSVIKITLQFNRSFTNQSKEESKYSGISVANALANHITNSGADIYCNA